MRRVIAGACVGVLVIAVAGCSGPAATSSKSGRESTTAVAGYTRVSNGPVIKVQGTASTSFPARSSKPAVTVVNLWAQWCGPCRKEAPVLRAAYAQLAPKGVVFVGVDTEDAQGRANGFARAHGWTWPQFYDENGLTLHSAHFAGLPDTLILGASGRLDGYYDGPVTSVSGLVSTVTSLAAHS